MNIRTVVLTPLKPLQAYEDQNRIARDCKMREEQTCDQEEKKKKESEQGEKSISGKSEAKEKIREKNM